MASISNHLTNITIPPNLVLEITQVRIVRDHGEPPDENDDLSERKCNPRMPWTNPIENSYHEQKGRPSLIGDGGGLPIRGENVLTSNGGGEPFNNGGNDLPRGGGNSPPRGGNSDLLGGDGSGPLGDQNAMSYIVGPTRPWIRPT